MPCIEQQKFPLPLATGGRETWLDRNRRGLLSAEVIALMESSNSHSYLSKISYNTKVSRITEGRCESGSVYSRSTEAAPTLYILYDVHPFQLPQYRLVSHPKSACTETMAVSIDFIVGLIFNLISLTTSLINIWQSQKVLAMNQCCKFVPRQTKLAAIGPSPDSNV